MMTLAEHYTELGNDTKRWSYYEKDKVDFLDILANEEKSLEFILDYFRHAGKENIFNDDIYKERESQLREHAQHTVSTFLLGILIAEAYKFDLCERDDSNLNFKYLWFLTCFYHDFGYAFEESNINLEGLNREGLKHLIELFNLRYLDESPFVTYKSETIDSYLKIRADKVMFKLKLNPKADHGIIGGILLYELLRKQFDTHYLNRTDKKNMKDNFYVYDYKSNRPLHLTSKHFEAYKEAADAIIIHNIWKDTFEFIERSIYYEEYKIINKDMKTAFILSLADTLEPLKKEKLDINNLNYFYFEKLDKNNGFRVIGKNNECNTIIENTHKISDWVNVKIENDLNYHYTVILRCL